VRRFVANYLVRFRVNTHVTASLVSRLHVPFIDQRSPAFRWISDLVRQLLAGSGPVDETSQYAELQAHVAMLYGLKSRELEHILSTFPLVPERIRSSVLHEFDRLLSHTGRGDAETRRR
jgi:hypothetical protein